MAEAQDRSGGGKHEVTYFVNTERQTTDDHKLTGREILEKAGFTPAEDYNLVRNDGHHQIGLDDTESIHDNDGDLYKTMTESSLLKDFRKTAAKATRVYATGTIEKVCDLYGPSEDTTYSTFARRGIGDRDEIWPGSRSDGRCHE
jgi:hypothetical protein